MVVDRCDLPKGFDINKYEFFQGMPARFLSDHDISNLGGQKIEAQMSGHAPRHLCFGENDNRYLFTGDLVYKDILFTYYPSADPESYLDSLKKISALPVKKYSPRTTPWTYSQKF